MTRSLSVVAACAAVLLLAACADPSDNVPAASVAPATNSAPAAPLTTTNGTYYAFGTNGSRIGFIGSKVTGSHEGGFRNFAGEFLVKDGQIGETGGRVMIETDSLWSDNDRLTSHLKSADFFDVAKFPNAIFQVTGFQQKGTNASVSGNLTLHGVTKKIAFPAQVHVEENAMRLNAQFAINRIDFEMKYPGKADDLIREMVVLQFELRAQPGRADFQKIEKPAAPPAPVPGNV